MNVNQIKQAAEKIVNAKYLTAFTGAGISVESGIPPFRGDDGLWSKVNPDYFDINYFRYNPAKSWELRQNFFKDILNAQPNEAHKVLAKLEELGLLKAVITQNIDSLHFKAGNKNVYEFHGNSRDAVCMDCGARYSISDLNLENLPPKCEKCGGVLKPDFVFFGEPIPVDVMEASFRAAENSDVMLVIGTTGIVYPASSIPSIAKQENDCFIIEVNIEPSEYTGKITDIFLQGKATEIMSALMNEINKLLA